MSTVGHSHVIGTGCLAMALGSFALGLAVPQVAEAQAGVGARTGAAVGAVFSFLTGGDLFDVAESAAIGAATGAVGGAVAEDSRRQRNDRLDLERLRRQEIEMLQAERERIAAEQRRHTESLAREAEERRIEEARLQALAEAERRQEAERLRETQAETRRLEEQRARAVQEDLRRLEEERQLLAEERRKLEATLAEARAQGGALSDLPQSDEEWIAAVGQDNFRALEALFYCQYDRATLLAQVAKTDSNPNFQLASRWVDVLVAVDRGDRAAAEPLFEELVILDDDVASVQQASLYADQSMIEIGLFRRAESVSCSG